MRQIAVYGTLRRGFDNYGYLLYDQEFLGQEVLELPFKMISLGGYPGLIATKDNHPITVEVFNIDDEAARSVDHLEGFPGFYTRKIVDTGFGPSWIYYLEDKQYQNLVEITSGDWAKYVEPIEHTR